MSLTNKSSPLEGGCLCGQVRYTIAEVFDAGYCHCNRCKKGNGAPVVAWAHVKSPNFQIVSGEPARFQSSADGSREFCANCGSPLFFKETNGNYFSVNIGSLDDPEAIRPSVHMCSESHVSWLVMGDIYPRVDGNTLEHPAKRKNPYGEKAEVSAQSQISLREVTKENLVPLLKLEAGGHQRKYVASNWVSLAQVPFDDVAWTRAIYADDTPIGLVMVRPEDENLGEHQSIGQPSLWRFMIDYRYQRKGLGRAAMALVIEEVSAWPDAKTFYLTYVRGAHSPGEFYKSLGFVDTESQIEGEWIMKLDLAD